jgi:hypothetical protein
MSLLAPLGLLGLLTLPLIVLLHLLRERSRRARISSLELWRWLDKEVRGPRLRRIPLTWILLLHLLLALLLTAAVVQPQLHLSLPFGRAVRLILIVDSSTSMGAAAGPSTRLAQAQAMAAAQLAGLAERDSAVLISAGPRAVQLDDSGAEGAADVARVAGALAGLRAAGAGNDWDGALALAAAAMLPEHHNRIVILTDGAFEFPARLAALELPAEVEWRRVGAEVGNQAVIALTARPGLSGAVEVFARIANFSDAPARPALTLVADGNPVDQFELALAASEVAAQAWTLPPETGTVEVRLASTDALPADDVAALGVLSSRPVDVLLVAEAQGGSDAHSVLARALEALPNVRLQTTTPANYAPFEGHELTVFYQWLPEAWPRGAILVVEPPEGSALLPATGVEAVGALTGDRLDPLLADLDLARLRFGSALRLRPVDTWTAVLADNNGLGLVWRGTLQGGQRIVALTFVLADSNITRRAAFPILIANAVDALLPPSVAGSLVPGEAILLPTPQLFPRLTLTRPGGEIVAFGANRPAAYADTFAPGLYLLSGETAGGEAWQAGFGVNAGSLEESELRRAAAPDFAAGGSAGLAAAGARAAAVDVWPFVVGAVLLLLVVEAWLAWR